MAGNRLIGMPKVILTKQMNKKHLTKNEITLLIRALKANVQAAKSSATALEAKLQRAFEAELNTIYPFAI
jgi:hypothetical protein